VRPNQSAAFPEINQSGGTVVGEGKPAFPRGTIIPPTQIQIIRPQKARMSIDQSNIVDSIGIDPTKNQVQLIVTDHLGWTGDDRLDNEHMYLLQEKINAYLRFIESGEIYKAYPQARGKSLVIRVVAKFGLSTKAQKFFDTMQNNLRASGYKITFEKLTVS
jgi:hypothetical protein